MQKQRMLALGVVFTMVVLLPAGLYWFLATPVALIPRFATLVVAFEIISVLFFIFGFWLGEKESRQQDTARHKEQRGVTARAR